MGIKLNNNASSLTVGTIAIGDLALTVTAASGVKFPVLAVGDYFYATLQDTLNNIEVVRVTARATDALTIVRAQEGTTALAWAGGTLFEQRMTAQTFYDYTAATVAASNALKVDRTSLIGSALIPASTTINRDAVPATGYFRFNTDLVKFEGYNGTAWGSVGGGATGAGTDAVFIENDQTVNTSYTITTGKNAMSAGPVTIANGAIITIPTGATWSII